MSVNESFNCVIGLTVKSCLSDTLKAYISITGQLRLLKLLFDLSTELGLPGLVDRLFGWLV